MTGPGSGPVKGSRYPWPNVLQRIPLALDAVQSLAVAAVRRGRGLKKHPDWSLRYELAMSTLYVVAHRYPELAMQLARGSHAPLPRDVRDKVRLESGRRLAQQDVEVYTPIPDADSSVSLLYLHGGGYVTCSPRSHRDVISRIALASGARCLAPDYRLAPAHPFPAALDDVLACYRALARSTPADKVFLAGDSAGGGLCLALMLRLRDAGEPLPRGAILLSPWVDLSLSAQTLSGQAEHDYLPPSRTARNALAYAGSASTTHPLISPIYADLRGLPPLLVQTGGWELLREQNLRFVERARAAGVEVSHHVAPGMLHAYPCFAGISPQGARAIAAAGAFVRGLSESLSRAGCAGSSARL